MSVSLQLTYPSLQDPQICYSITEQEPYIDVREQNREQTQPGPEPVLTVEHAEPALRLEPALAAAHTRVAVHSTAYQVPQGVAREAVHPQQRHVDQEDQGPHRDPE